MVIDSHDKRVGFLYIQEYATFIFKARAQVFYREIKEAQTFDSNT